MAALGVVAFAFVLVAATACGGDPDRREPVNFRQGSGTLTIPTEGLAAVGLSLTADDTSFFGPANLGETTNTLELSLRSEANDIWISLLLLNVRTTRGYVLDSDTGGHMTVLLGEICDGAMGNLLGPDCRWYSSDFFHADCFSLLETLDGKTVEGHINCGSLGANCPTGTGIRTASGACADGERLPPIAFTATFRLQEPFSTKSP